MQKCFITNLDNGSQCVEAVIGKYYRLSFWQSFNNSSDVTRVTWTTEYVHRVNSLLRNIHQQFLKLDNIWTLFIALGLQINMRNWKLFSYFSTKTYVVGTQKNPLNETVLLSTQNICLACSVRK